MPRLRWLVIFAIASFIVVVSLVTFMKELGRIERLSLTLEKRMEELVEVTRRNQELLEKISYYRTPAGIAHLAREEFNLVMPGEKIYKIEVVSSDNDAKDKDTKKK